MIDKDPATYQPSPRGRGHGDRCQGQLRHERQAPSAALAGLSIPVIDDPTILFDLISGGDIPLVEFDSGPLTLGFQFQKSFGPIYAPPPVMMVIGGGASVSMRIAAGFDTYGIRRAIETGDAAQVLDSLYFKTVDKNGTPIPVVQFTGYLEAGASVSIGILEVGVVGGIKLTVGFYWNDPNNDGKFRLFEFGAAVANNPICLFNVGGGLALHQGVRHDRVQPVLGELRLHAGQPQAARLQPQTRLHASAAEARWHHGRRPLRLRRQVRRRWTARRQPWDANDKNETWVVRQVPAYTDDDGAHDAAVEMRGLGITESFPDTAADPITTVVLDGRGYKGNLTVTFTGGSAPVEDAKPVAFTKKAVVFTGDGRRRHPHRRGRLVGRLRRAHDNITTLDRTDLSTAADSVQSHVAGGPGADIITVGNGKDTVTGDGSLRFTTSARTVDLAPVKAGTLTLSAAVDVGTLQDPTDADLYAATPRPTGRRPDRCRPRPGPPVRQRRRRHHRHRERQHPRGLRRHQGGPPAAPQQGGPLPRPRLRARRRRRQ